MAEKKILIVEDDQDVRAGLNVRLRAEGFQTAFAVDGVQAMSAAREHEPDLILLDLGLPAGDGFVFLERLKKRAELATIPVIVLSARDPAANERRALDAGAFAYFEKPADDAVLVATIHQALAAARAA